MQTLPAIELLFETQGGGLGLPEPLAKAYGGDLRLPPDCVVANFVESVDGVVAFPDAGVESGGIVSSERRCHGLVSLSTGISTACAYLRPHLERASSGTASGSTSVIT